MASRGKDQDTSTEFLQGISFQVHNAADGQLVQLILVNQLLRP